MNTYKKQKEKELPVYLFLTLALLIVMGVSKMLVLARDSLEAKHSLAAENMAPLPNSVTQNQLSMLVYDGYLK